MSILAGQTEPESLRLIDSRMGEWSGVVDYGAEVADIDPATACGTTTVVMRRVDSETCDAVHRDIFL
jgi:hypothetical protein